MSTTNATGEHYCSNRYHGLMVLRPIDRQTPEQRWCGTWYDCQHCTSSAVEQSPELIAYLASFGAGVIGIERSEVVR